MFGRVIHQTKAGRCEGKQLQTHSSFPASKSVVPWQQAQPCDQTSLKRHKNNPLSKMIKEGNVIQLVFCSTLLRVSWLHHSFQTALTPLPSSSPWGTEARHLRSHQSSTTPASSTSSTATTASSHQQAKITQWLQFLGSLDSSPKGVVCSF